MIATRPYYAVLTLCLLGCGKSAAIKDESVKAPASTEIVNPKATDESETEEVELEDWDSLPPEVRNKKYEPHGPAHVPFGGQ